MNLRVDLDVFTIGEAIGVQLENCLDAFFDYHPGVVERSRLAVGE